MHSFLNPQTDSMSDLLKEYKIPHAGLKKEIHEFAFELDEKFFAHFENSIINKCDIQASITFDKRQEPYIIDVDFDIQDLSEEEFQVFTKISINNDEVTEAGYKISVEGTGVFRIDPNIELPDTHRANLKNYSAVNLLINRLRTHILQTTGMSVFGPYDLPPIDITDLFAQKASL